MRSHPNRAKWNRLPRLAIALSAAVAAAVGVAPAGVGARARDSQGQPHRFLGNCQIKVTSTRDANTGRFHAVGQGRCDGQLDGRSVSRAPFQTEFSGTSTRVGPALIEQHGSGVIAITDPARGEATSFGMSERTVGTVGTITCSGGGDGLVAIAPAAPPSTTTTYLGTVHFTRPCTSG